MGQNNDRLEPRQTYVRTGGVQRVRVQAVLLDKAEVRLRRVPSDTSHPTFNMDISEFLRNFRLEQ